MPAAPHDADGSSPELVRRLTRLGELCGDHSLDAPNDLVPGHAVKGDELRDDVVEPIPAVVDAACKRRPGALQIIVREAFRVAGRHRECRRIAAERYESGLIHACGTIFPPGRKSIVRFGSREIQARFRPFSSHGA